MVFFLFHVARKNTINGKKQLLFVQTEILP